MSKQEQNLLAIFRSLEPEQRAQVLAFSEFLLHKQQQQPKPALLQPQLSPRPAQESVVAAIKRLSAAYPMLDKAPLLNTASALMSQHVLQGKAASEVIDELEELFVQHYARFTEQHSATE